MHVPAVTIALNISSILQSQTCRRPYPSLSFRTTPKGQGARRWQFFVRALARVHHFASNSQLAYVSSAMRERATPSSAYAFDHRYRLPARPRLATAPLKSCVDVDAGDLSAGTKYCPRIQHGASASMFNFDLFPNAPLSVRQLLKRATWSLTGLCMHGDGYQASECKNCWS